MNKVLRLLETLELEKEPRDLYNEEYSLFISLYMTTRHWETILVDCRRSNKSIVGVRLDYLTQEEYKNKGLYPYIVFDDGNKVNCKSLSKLKKLILPS